MQLHLPGWRSNEPHPETCHNIKALASAKKQGFGSEFNSICWNKALTRTEKVALPQSENSHLRALTASKTESSWETARFNMKDFHTEAEWTWPPNLNRARLQLPVWLYFSTSLMNFSHEGRVARFRWPQRLISPVRACALTSRHRHIPPYEERGGP